MDPSRPRTTPEDRLSSESDPSQDEARATFSGEAPALCRDAIMPQGPHWKSNESDPWEVKITLLPSASCRIRPVKHSKEYWRLKSRGLITTALVPARDAVSFTTTVSLRFRDVLRGRKWAPLQSLEEPSTSSIYLLPLSPDLLAREQNFDFLAEECLIENEKHHLSLFIAPTSGTLSWNFIRQLPRVALPLRARHDIHEDFWDPPESSHPAGRVSRASASSIATKLPPSLPSDSVASAAPETPCDSTVTRTPDNNVGTPSSVESSPPATIERDAKGKFPCPDPKCPRARVTFSNRDFCIEHWEKKHKGSVTREIVDPGTQSESKKPPLAAPASKPVDVSTGSAVRPTHHVEPPAEEGVDDSTEIIPSFTASTSGLESPPKVGSIFISLPIRSHAPSSSNSTSNPGRAPASRPPDKTTSSNSAAGRRKRRRISEGDGQQNDANDGDDGDNGDDQDAGDNGSHSGDNSPTKLFACPFFKHDPQRYLSCAGGIWPQFHRVKEHIFRKHDLAHQCGRCWQRFKTKNLLTDHSRATTACAVKTEAESPDDVTPQQVEQLKRRKRDGSSHVERWNDMYKTLFQPMDGDDIPSPWNELPVMKPSNLPDYQTLSLDEYRMFVSNPPDEWTRLVEQSIDEVCRNYPSLSLEDRRMLARDILDKLPHLQLRSLDAFTGREAAECSNESSASQAGDAGNDPAHHDTTSEVDFARQIELDISSEKQGEERMGDPAYDTTAFMPCQNDGEYIIPRIMQDPFSVFPHPSVYASAEQTGNHDRPESDSAWYMQLLIAHGQDSEEAVFD